MRAHGEGPGLSLIHLASNHQFSALPTLNHSDHVNLLRPANLPPGGAWADFGAGTGAFTLALRELVGEGAQIYAVDKDRASLQAVAGSLGGALRHVRESASAHGGLLAAAGPAAARRCADGELAAFLPQ